MQENFKWVDEFLDACQQALGFMDLSTLQPTSWRHCHPLFAREWMDWFSKIVEEREKQGVSFEKLASVLHPGLMHAHLIFTMEDAKVAHLPKEKRLEYAQFFHNLIAGRAQGDYFSLHGSNRVHTKQEITQIIQRKFETGTPDAARAQGRLFNAAYNLGAALYLDFYMDETIVLDGPYELGNGRILVVKEANFLRPSELWPDLTVQADNVKIYAVYQGVKFSLDLITCHSQFDGDPIAGLKEWRIEKDGKPVTSLPEIDAIANNLAENGKTQWKVVKNMSEQELLEKAVWIRCYVFKPACDLLGIDWKPTKEMLNAVGGKTLEQGYSIWRQPAGQKEAQEYNRKIWDPRVDAYP